jgi:hypothetical protein
MNTYWKYARLFLLAAFFVGFVFGGKAFATDGTLTVSYPM